MKKLVLLLSAIGGMAALSAKADEARLLRFPSTNGTDVVFTYAGDLYKAPITGGTAQRLTSHEGYEMFARLSPDGKTIAFTAQYDGNTEVYSMPLDGGEPKRLTYTSTNGRDDLGDRMGPNNVVMTWSPDGKKIVYRNRISDSFDGKLWTIAPEGGMSELIPLPEGGFCSYSPDGKQLAYNRVMREFRTWKHYKGGMADDVWIYDPKAKSVTNITENESQDIFPMWIGDEIFYCSDRDFTMNLFVYNTKTKKTEKVTNYEDYDVRFPSTNGNIIVYEHAGYIYKFDPKTRKSEQIHITLNAEGNYARTELKNVSGNVTAVSVSGKGDRLAITARGEVFSVPVKKGVIKNITRTPGANERGAQYSPDGKTIAYISDRTGETEIWVQNTETGETKQLTKGTDTYISSLQWSPNGKVIIYGDRKNRLVKVDPVTGAKETLMQNPDGGVRPNFSADSKWITYSRSGSNNMGVIYVMNLDTKKEIAVTEKWYNSSSPMFSKDGKYLIISSDRDFTPQYSQTEWNHIYTNMSALYLVLLSKDTPSPMLVTEGSEEKTEPKAEKTDPKGGKDVKGAKPEAKEAKDIKIDADGIENRIIKLPIKGRAGAIYCDNNKLYFSAGRGTSILDLTTGKSEEICDSRISIQNGKAVVQKGGRGGMEIYVMDIPKGKARLDNPVDTKNMVAEIDYSQEWAQIFDETWRAFRDGFYLENMHGIDWKAMKDKYAVLVPYVKHRLDLNYVIGGMIGELACGHAYVSPGQYNKAKTIDMGLLGAEISRDKSGFYKIDRILPGAPYAESLRSPLLEAGLNIKEGDFITAIDGVSVKETTNIYSMLIGKAGVLTELTVNNTASDKGARKVIVTPIKDEYPLYHHEWVEKNLKYVEEKSGGKIGYVYIPDMNVDGLNEFARYYYAQLDKEALIVDDRANGGGNVSPMIIERLLREPYRMTMYRNREKNGTIPEGTLHGPKVCLINKYSASDGDLFPWSFKATGLGKLIGTRTWGGIVGISGSLPYMDGTDVRVPFFTNFSAETGEWIVENHGVDPDILIDNDPILEQKGIDQQLDKAIEVLLEEIKSRKPLPKTPAPRTLKDLGW